MLWHLCHHRWHFPKGFASWAKLLGMVKFPPYDGSPHTQKHTPTRTRNNTPQDKTRQYDIRPSLKAAKTRGPPFIYREPPLYTEVLAPWWDVVWWGGAGRVGLGWAGLGWVVVQPLC